MKKELTPEQKRKKCGRKVMIHALGMVVTMFCFMSAFHNIDLHQNLIRLQNHINGEIEGTLIMEESNIWGWQVPMEMVYRSGLVLFFLGIFLSFFSGISFGYNLHKLKSFAEQKKENYLNKQNI